MPRFSYSGIDRTGAPVSGERDADSAHALITALRAVGEFAHHVKDLDQRPGFGRGEAPVRLQDLSLFCGHLAALIQSGMPLAPALRELAVEARGKRLRNVLEEARRAVEGGETLEDALAHQGGRVPPLFLSLIRVGERTGNLPGVLLQLSAFGQRRIRFSQRIQATLAYPTILFVSLLVFLGIFVPQVIGQFETMYEQVNGTLPWPTALILQIGEMTKFVILFLFTLPLFGMILVMLHLTPARLWAQRFLERVLLALPWFGRHYAAMLEARYYQALGTLLDNGAPIVESLCLAGEATGSPGIASASIQAAARVAQGEPVSEVLAKFGIAKSSHAWMLLQAEHAGALPGALLRMADQCHQDLEMEELSLCATSGPTLIAIAGLIAGFSIVACFLPILEIFNLV